MVSENISLPPRVPPSPTSRPCRSRREHVAGARGAVVLEVLLGVQAVAAAARRRRAPARWAAGGLPAGAEPRLAGLRAQRVVGVELGARLVTNVGGAGIPPTSAAAATPRRRRSGWGLRWRGRTSRCARPRWESVRWPWAETHARVTRCQNTDADQAVNIRFRESGRSRGLCTPGAASQVAAIELTTRAAVASTPGWSLPESVSVTSTWARPAPSPG